jgi:hypothetical protein
MSASGVPDAVGVRDILRGEDSVRGYGEEPAMPRKLRGTRACSAQMTELGSEQLMQGEPLLDFGSFNGRLRRAQAFLRTLGIEIAFGSRGGSERAQSG